MPGEPLTEQSILHQQPRLGAGDRFTLECRRDMPCFTR
jgi:hypothetical protein